MASKRTNPRDGLVPEPFWYKSGVIYELHVRAFYDSDDDGIGDFRGLTQKLDYLKDLGVTALWLLPFYPSPLKDDGYDISDYYDVHPIYGTLADFKLFLREAHHRNLRVITELVMNHTSEQHAWFQKSRRAPSGSKWRNFYVWSDTPDKYRDARIIFKDVEVSNWTWDHVAKAHYWHRFFSHQPDLNFDNPQVYEEMVRVLDFWLDLGVDGLRLDAVPYLYEREGTSCENLPETHECLRRLRKHVDEKYGDRMLLAEANQWPEDAVAYFGRGDECHMAFHFPLMPRLFMALRMEDRIPIVDILEQTPAIPETAQWALFLRNHDELTLEMVTDEERDYMYRTYAHVHQARLHLGIRRRLAPLLGNERKRIELLNALLLSLPGTPVLYYGDEIGMGENIFLGDRNGVRTPMQWSPDRNAGFSRANPQSLYLPIISDPEYHFEAVNVEGRLQNPHSLLWWMRRLLSLRKRWRALGEGRCEFLQPANRKILSYILRYKDETLLVVANLSRFMQPVELDLSAFKGSVPVELFGRMELPAIGDKPYFLTLNPHAFFWLSLASKSVSATETPAGSADTPMRSLTLPDDWTSIVNAKQRAQIEPILSQWLQRQPWFCGQSRTILHASFKISLPIPPDNETVLMNLVQLDYLQGDPELYALTLAFADGPQAEALRRDAPRSILCELNLPATGRTGVLHGSVAVKEVCAAVGELICSRRRHKFTDGELEGWRTPVLRRVLGPIKLSDLPVNTAGQSQSSVVFGDKFILKFFRRIDNGLNPDLEIARFLTEREFPHAAQLAGALEFCPNDGERLTLGMLNQFVPGAKSAWDYTLDALGRYYDRVATLVAHGQAPPPIEPFSRNIHAAPAAAVTELVGTYLDSSRLLGERTAELHQVLASNTEDPAFAPEPFTPHHARGVFQSMRNEAKRNFGLLRERIKSFPAPVARLGQRVLELEPAILRRYRLIYERRIAARRIRCHGDFHLGQVLFTGKDFVLIDFEGEPALPLGERRLKRSPLRDAAGMTRSFHYAALEGLNDHVKRGSLDNESRPKFEPWLRLWYQAVSSEYLRAYFHKMSGTDILPRSEEEQSVLFFAYLLHKAVYEVGWELSNRPEWLATPLEGVLLLMEDAR